MFQNELVAVGLNGKTQLGIDAGDGVTRLNHQNESQDFRAVTDVGKDLGNQVVEFGIGNAGGSRVTNDLHKALSGVKKPTEKAGNGLLSQDEKKERHPAFQPRVPETAWIQTLLTNDRETWMPLCPRPQGLWVRPIEGGHFLQRFRLFAHKMLPTELVFL